MKNHKQRKIPDKDDKILYIVLMAWSLLQFFIFYICVNFNSVLLSFEKIDMAASPAKTYFSFGYFSDNLKTFFSRVNVVGDEFKNMILTSLEACGIFIVVSIPLQLLFSYYIRKFVGSNFFRVLLFMPSIISTIVITPLFKYFVSDALPVMLSDWFGIETSGNLLYDAATIFPTIMFFNIWLGFGTSVLMYSNVVGEISPEIIDASKIDGKKFVSDERFSVKQTLITLGEGSSVSYGKGRYSDTDAFIVSVAKGETFYFNRAFDLSNLSKSEALLSFFIDPLTKGTFDAGSVYFVFTGAINSEEKLTIRVNNDSGENGGGRAYIAAGGDNQSLTGVEIYAGSPIIHKGDEWGTPVWLSFDAQNNLIEGKPSKSDYSVCSLNYDSDENALYAKKACFGKLGLIADFDDPSCFSDGLWEGFTGGKAFLSVYGDGFVNNTVDVCFASVRGFSQKDLENRLGGELIDDEAPVLTVKSEELPNARFGYYYAIPDAEAYDVYSGVCSVDTKVLYNGKISVDIENGKFLADKKGFYSIVYASADDGGNIATNTVTVYVSEKENDIVITLGETQTSAKCGDRVDILPPENVSGGLGKLSYSVKVVKDGEETPVTDCFYPESTGEYTVEYTVVDYTGYEKTASYVLSVTTDGVPKLVEKVNFPEYILGGMTYTFGEHYADDYSTGTLVKKPISLEIKTADETKTYSAGEKYSVTPTVNGEIAEFVLRCGEHTLKTEEIAVIMPYTDGKLTVENYFVRTDGGYAVKKTQTGINFESAGSYSWTFAKDLVGDNFSAVVNGVKDGGNFDRLTFTLTDGEDEQVSVGVIFVRNGENYYCYAAGKRLELTHDFNDVSSSLRFGYEDGRVFIGGNYVSVKNDENGKEFSGFPSGKNYFSMKVESDEETTINLRKLCEYPFTRATRDLVAPQIVILDDYGGYYKPGDIYTVTPAVASDVLDVNVTLTVSVYGVNGEIVKSVDGVALKDADPSVAYKIRLGDYGQYEVKYKVADGNASDEISYAVNVPDTTAPEFVFEKGFETAAKAGDVYVIPAFTVKDNLTAADKIEVYKYVINPDGRIIAIDGDGFRFSKAGEYVFCIAAYDEAFNGKTIKVKVTVTE